MQGFLTEEQIRILREAHYSCRLRKPADRIKAILLLNDGFSYEQVAKILMLDSITIRRYEKQFESVGVDGLIECRYLGSDGTLTKMQEMGLITHLRNHTYQTVKEIVIYAQKHYRKSYSIEGMTHLLHRIGFVYKKTKQVPGKVNLEDMAITVLSEKTIDTEAMKRLVMEIEKKQTKGTIHLLTDNASHNHSYQSQDFLKNHKRVHITYFPAYSPNLNIIERLWKFFHTKHRDKYFEKFKEFEKEVLYFFKHIHRYDVELKTLLTDSFQTMSI